MIYFISVVHALTCIFIVLFILLQDPKGGVLGSLGGGGSKSFFGSEGASPFLVSVTKWLTICFACSSFYLSYMSSKKDSSIMANTEIEQTETKKEEQSENSAAEITEKHTTDKGIQQPAPQKTEQEKLNHNQIPKGKEGSDKREQREKAK